MKNNSKVILVLLLILMILFSIFMGVKTNLGWFSLYGGEIEGPISELKRGLFPTYKMPIWIMLLVTHCFLISLPIWLNYTNFRRLLIFVPLVFIFLSTVLEPGDIFFLVPFMAVWLITLVKQNKMQTN